MTIATFYCIFRHNNTVKASILIPSCPPALFIITCKFRKIVYFTKVRAVVLKF